MKIDLSKLLNAHKKDSKESQALSVKIFSISNEVRDSFLTRYLKICDDLHLIKFIEWRRRNRKFQLYAPKTRYYLDD